MFVVALTELNFTRNVYIEGLETSFHSRVTTLSFNTSIGRNTHAWNNCGSANYRLGAWFGYFVHTGRFYSYSIGYCDHRYRYSCYSGPATSLIAGIFLYGLYRGSASTNVFDWRIISLWSATRLNNRGPDPEWNQTIEETWNPAGGSSKSSLFSQLGLAERTLMGRCR